MTRHNGLCSSLLLVVVLATACLGIGCGAPKEEGRRPERPSIPAPPDVSAPPADSTRTPSGISSKVLKPGTGTRHPRPNSEVTVHYTGWTTDGQMFESSLLRQEPTTFSLDAVIPGWTEGVQMMVEGESRRFWIPAKLAYEGMPDRPQGTLVFDIELLRIGS